MTPSPSPLAAAPDPTTVGVATVDDRVPRVAIDRLDATRTATAWSLGILIWGAGVLVLSLSGALAALPLVVLPALVVLGIVAPLVLVRLSPVSRRAVSTVDIAHLTWFNVWRVPAAAAFFVVGARGLLPEQFVSNAAWGDLVAGALAPLVVLLGTRLAGAARRRAYLAFHLFSFGDFVVAVGTGLTFTLLGDPLMRTLLDTPMALIPLWGVPLTGAVSLLSLRRLTSSPGALQPR